MQLITTLLFLAAGHAVRATDGAHSAALGDAARADVCARDADFYAFAVEDGTQSKPSTSFGRRTPGARSST